MFNVLGSMFNVEIIYIYELLSDKIHELSQPVKRFIFKGAILNIFLRTLMEMSGKSGNISPSEIGKIIMSVQSRIDMSSFPVKGKAAGYLYQ
jgi:hypothetical protein